MTLGNTVPLARTFSKCAATDKAFETPLPLIHRASFSAELLKNFFSANVLWLKEGLERAWVLCLPQTSNKEGQRKGVVEWGGGATTSPMKVKKICLHIT